jgi:hypothetical protein
MTFTRSTAASALGARCPSRDCGDKPLVPGFLAAHSHYMGSPTVANPIDRYPPPDGPGSEDGNVQGYARSRRARRAGRARPESVAGATKIKDIRVIETIKDGRTLSRCGA